MNEEWGPMIEHDGKGCPRDVVGVFLYIETDTPRVYEMMITDSGGRSWDWANSDKFARVIRYKKRRPYGMLAIDALMDTLPVVEYPEVDVLK